MPVGDLGIWPVTIETREDSREKNIGVRGKLQTFKQFKRGGESRVPQLDSHNRFNVLATEINTGTFKLEESKKKTRKERSLREVTVKIRLERIDI